MFDWNGKDGILVTGLVEDVKQYLARAMVSIAPLFVGTGTKLKILEALAAGLPVVTTTLGVEGIDATNGVDILLADTAQDFAGHCIRLLQDSALRDHLALAGQALVRQKYDVSVISHSVLRCYDRLDGGRAGTG
jgi:glycosyltransferase involved in cell wall biosynthesis